MRRIKVAIDASISPRLVGMLEGLYGKESCEFVKVAELMPGPTADEVWADRFAQFGGNAVLSADPKIAYRPHQLRAFVQNGFVSVFLAGAWSRMPGHAKAAHLAYWWPTILESMRSGAAGQCWRVPCSHKKGELRLLLGPFDELKAPDEVLSRTPKPRHGKRGAA